MFRFLGTVLSRKVHLRLAELDVFPTYDRVRMVQVRRGNSLRIPCKPPSGVPDPEIYWTDNTNTADRFGYRVINPRIQQDYHGLFCSTVEFVYGNSVLGNLYFLNVKDEDEQKQFVCNAFSRKLNVIRRGTLTKLQVIKSDPINRKPMKLWSSKANQVALKGQKLSLKCIFGGLPTPKAVWRKIHSTVYQSRSTFVLKKQELIIDNLQYEDAGVYECRGHNG